MPAGTIVVTYLYGLPLESAELQLFPSARWSDELLFNAGLVVGPIAACCRGYTQSRAELRDNCPL